MIILKIALLPNAQLIAVLLEPGERAYSWYQHQKAHAVDAAMKYSFGEILTSTESDPVAFGLRQVRFEIKNKF